MVIDDDLCDHFLIHKPFFICLPCEADEGSDRAALGGHMESSQGQHTTVSKAVWIIIHLFCISEWIWFDFELVKTETIVYTVSYSVIFKTIPTSGAVRCTSKFRFIENIAVCQESQRKHQQCAELNGLEKYTSYGYSYFSKWKYFHVCDLFLLDLSVTSTVCHVFAWVFDWN